MPSFKKSLIVEQFQGNYLNGSGVSSARRVGEGLGNEVIETEQSLETCTLRSSFGHLTANGNPLFAVSGFTLPVCSYLGITIRGW